MNGTAVNTPNVKKPDVADFSAGTGVAKPLPPGGRDHEYLLKVTRVDASQAKRTNAGFLQAEYDAVVVAPNTPYDGAEIRYNTVHTQNWPNKKISGAAEFLRAIGAAQAPATDADYVAAFQAAKGKTFKATLQWKAFNKDAGVDIKGMENFPVNVPAAEGGALPAPKLPAGAPLPYVLVTDPADSTKMKKVYANARVWYTIPPIK